MNDSFNKNEFDYKSDKLFQSIIKKYKDFENQQKVVVINPEQYLKFRFAYESLKSMVKEQKGKITICDLNPSELHGWIEIQINNIDSFTPEMRNQLVQLIEKVDVFNIEGVEEGKILIGVNINNCFVKIQNQI